MWMWVCEAIHILLHMHTVGRVDVPDMHSNLLPSERTRGKSVESAPHSVSSSVVSSEESVSVSLLLSFPSMSWVDA